jgi:hypothetical protein
MMTTAERIAAAIAAMRAILDHEEIGDIECHGREAQDGIVALADAPSTACSNGLAEAAEPPNSDHLPPPE